MGSSVQFSHSIMSDSLWPHGLQHARLPCPSPAPGAYSNSCPSSRWCHPTISSSAIPFSSCLQSSPASGPFPTSQFFASGGQSIGVSASASALQWIWGVSCREWKEGRPEAWTRTSRAWSSRANVHSTQVSVIQGTEKSRKLTNLRKLRAAKCARIQTAWEVKSKSDSPSWSLWRAYSSLGHWVWAKTLEPNHLVSNIYSTH